MTEHRENGLPYERRKDGILFPLRNEVKMLVRSHTETKVVVEMWRGLTMLPPDTGNLHSATFRERLARDAKLTFAEKGENGDLKDTVPNILEDVGMVALAMGSSVDDGDEKDGDGKTLWDILKKESPFQHMIRYAREGGEYWHTPEMEAYATVKVEAGHRESYLLTSRRYKLWLKREWYLREKARLEEDGMKDEDVTVFLDRSIPDVVSHFESLALFEGAEREVYVRVAGRDGRVYVDLCDPSWRVVEISLDGWRVISADAAPVRFIRSRGMLPLPEPAPDEAEGALERLRSLLNIADGPSGERSWRLILAWLVQALMPTGPYPVLTLLGPQGSAKSTTQRILRGLVDPSSVTLRGVPRDEHNVFIDAKSSWAISLDNMDTLPAWLANVLCRLATGGGFSVRQLYTDNEQVLFDSMRPVLLNGIADVINRPDLLDRALIINLTSVEGRVKPEKILGAEVEAAKPGILAAFFDAIATGLGEVDGVKLERLPRMADFARWGIATEKALGGKEGAFMAAYEGSQAEAIEAALEAYPMSEHLVEFALSFQGEDNAWIGTATQLLKTINDRVDDEEIKRSRLWPKQPNQLSEQLGRLAQPLRNVGVYAERLPSHKGGRKLRVFYLG